MSAKAKLIILATIFSIVGIAALAYLFTHDIAVLDPKGIIGEKQRDLLVLATFLMLLVVIPVFFLTFWIGWRYRADNTKAEHSPDWDHSLLAECVWWGIPFLIIGILGFYTYKGCHELDPFKPIEAKREIKIQAVALQWKWLFIYPEEKIVSVNYVRFPEKTSVYFEITAEAPMNSLWIPDLGGQVYAMPAMRSKLYLMANGIGQYRGSSANLSGKGFASMYFTAESSSQDDFASWVDSVRGSGKTFGMNEYNRLVEPSEYVPPAYYVLSEEGLFDQIIMKYMTP